MPDSPTVSQIAASLADALDADRYWRDGDPVGVWLDSPRPVRRLGLRLEAGRAPYEWARGLDAVLLHRPFGLWPARVPDGLGVLAYHGALDDHFSVGVNPDLAAALGLRVEAEPLVRGERPVGIVGALDEPEPYARTLGRIEDELGGTRAAVGPKPEVVERVAIVGAMTAELVAAAAERGASVFVTGQVRQPGVAAAGEHGVRVVAVGQGRGERWGLRHLGRLVRDRWPAVETVDLDA